MRSLRAITCAGVFSPCIKWPRLNSFRFQAPSRRDRPFPVKGETLEEWCAKHAFEEMPQPLRELKNELAGVRQHIWQTAPSELKDAVKTRQYPQLSLMSIRMQEGERKDLDTCVATLPSEIQHYGFLADSFLGQKNFDVAAYISPQTHSGINGAIILYPQKSK